MEYTAKVQGSPQALIRELDYLRLFLVGLDLKQFNTKIVPEYHPSQRNSLLGPSIVG